jgi:DNA-binding NtrC family response regulator
MYELHLLGDGGARRLAPIGTTPLLVGRSNTNDVVLEDERISSRHLRVWCEGDEIHLRDLGSRNGTRVNGQAISGERVVGPDDEIELGRALVLRVVSTESVPVPPTSLGPTLDDALARLQSLDPALAAAAERELRLRSAEGERWRRALEVLPQLVSAGRPSAVLRVVVDEVRRVTGAPVVAAVSQTRGSTALSHMSDLTGLFPKDTVPSSLLERVASEGGRAIWSDDALADQRFADRVSVRSLALVSVGCVPLGSSAVLYLSDPSRAGAFSAETRLWIEALCQVAAHFLERPTSLPAPEALPGMVGVSAAMGEVFDTVRAFAPMPWPMLILGETGTGKERIAAAIHELSGREASEGAGVAPFIAVNCGALSDELALSQLFGHEPGAFTGAERRHVGYLERAAKGTLFLDEVGELSPLVQARLLRVLQEGTFERLGGEKVLQFRARVVAATHRLLDDPEQRAPFRDDLFHRLAACIIRVPPLRERPEDIELLAEVLLERLLSELPRGTRLSLSAGAVRILQARTWPGNVRELENALRGAAARALSRRSTLLEPEHFDTVETHAEEAVDDLHAATLAFQTRRAREMLASCGDNMAEAARRLGVSRQFLYRLFAREQKP